MVGTARRSRPKTTPLNEINFSHEATKPRRELEVPNWNLKTRNYIAVLPSVISAANIQPLGKQPANHANPRE